MLRSVDPVTLAKPEEEQTEITIEEGNGNEGSSGDPDSGKGEDCHDQGKFAAIAEGIAGQIVPDPEAALRADIGRL